MIGTMCSDMYLGFVFEVQIDDSAHCKSSRQYLQLSRVKVLKPRRRGTGKNDLCDPLS